MGCSYILKLPVTFVFNYFVFRYIAIPLKKGRHHYATSKGVAAQVSGRPMHTEIYLLPEGWDRYNLPCAGLWDTVCAAEKCEPGVNVQDTGQTTVPRVDWDTSGYCEVGENASYSSNHHFHSGIFIFILLSCSNVLKDNLYVILKVMAPHLHLYLLD